MIIIRFLIKNTCHDTPRRHKSNGRHVLPHYLVNPLVLTQYCITLGPLLSSGLISLATMLELVHNRLAHPLAELENYRKYAINFLHFEDVVES